MNSGHQETSLDIQETQFGDPAVSKQRRVIHFSSGETLEEEEEEEEDEEQSSNTPPFTERAERARLSLKNVALLVGRISLLTCDFLGERLAGALGLNAAKYQYAIDQHHRDHKRKSRRATGDPAGRRAESTRCSPGLHGSRYGATGGAADSQKSCDGKHMDRKYEGCHNGGYQADGETWE